MDSFYVYEHWRPDTGACFYVGKGNGRRAWRMRGRSRHHRVIQSELIALGMAVDVRIVAQNLAEEAAFAMEQGRIAFYPLADLCNMTEGGEGVSGWKHSLECRKRIAASKTGRPGRKHTPEARAKMSLAKLSRNLSVEHRAALSLASLGKKWTPERRAKHGVSQQGRKRTPETIAKMRLANLGKKHTPETIAKMRVSMIEHHRLKRAQEDSRRSLAWLPPRAGGDGQRLLPQTVAPALPSQ